MTLPQPFIDSLTRMSSQSGGDSLSGLADALVNTDPVVGVRINPLKLSPGSVAEAPGSALRRVEWLPELGFTIGGERPRFTVDPALHQGLYYVQDPSSMAVATVISRLTAGCEHPLVCIDACAAPGGKTTAAISALPPGSLVIANEYDRRRADILLQNIIRWGYPNVYVAQGDTSRLSLLRHGADIIIADLPCSGEGMMRKDTEAVAQWSESLVEHCAALQSEIVDNLWPALRPGGYLVYSTCTFNIAENEQNVIAAASRLGAEIVDPGLAGQFGIAPAIGADIPVARFIPGRVNGEGLFMAILRKPGDSPSPSQLLTNSKPLSRLNLILPGFQPTTLKGRDTIPTHQAILAVGAPLGVQSNGAKVSAAPLPLVDLPYPMAMAYLRGEAICLPDDAPRGYVVVTYRGYPLGLAKNLGNRANNLLPASFRVLTTHIPPVPPAVIR